MLVGFVSHVLGSRLQSTSRQEQNGCNWRQRPGGEGRLCQPRVPIQHPPGCSEQSVVLASQAWLLMKKLNKTNSRRGLNLNLAFYPEHLKRIILQCLTWVTLNTLPVFIQPFFNLPFVFSQHHFSLIPLLLNSWEQ